MLRVSGKLRNLMGKKLELNKVVYNLIIRPDLKETRGKNVAINIRKRN